MAHFHITGKAKCPYFIKAERLADSLALALPDFKVEKTIVPNEKWAEWVTTNNKKYGWQHLTSPVIWRQLGAGNTRGSLVGGYEAFAALMGEWYGVSASVSDSEIADIAQVNAALAANPAKLLAPFNKPSVRVAITNATSDVVYVLLPRIARGDVFGHDQPIEIILLDTTQNLSALNGVMMEVEDCGYGLVSDLRMTTNPETAFRSADVILLVQSNASSAQPSGDMVTFAKAIDAAATPNTLVVLVGSQAHVDAHVLARLAPILRKRNITYVSQHSQHRAQQVVADHLNIDRPLDLQIRSVDVHNTCVLGSGDDVIVNTSLAYVINYGAVVGPSAKTQLNLTLSGDFITKELSSNTTTRSQQGNARRGGSPMTVAHAIAHHINALWLGTPKGEVVSMGVSSEGNNLGLEPGAFVSLPVVCAPRQWTFAQGINLSDVEKQALAESVDKNKKQAAAVLAAFPQEEKEKEKVAEAAPVAAATAAATASAASEPTEPQAHL